jgi:predicted amidohydrolase YtcJ
MRTVSVLLVVLLSATCARFDSDSFLMTDVNGYTLDSAGSLVRFNAIAIRNGRVLAMGSADTMKVRGLRRVSGGGRTLLPGLIDAHAHVMGLGQSIMSVDLMGLNSKEDALAKVKAFADAHPDRQWVIGRGWNQTLWSNTVFPTAADLDRIISDRPVLLERVDGHATWVNSMALSMAGIDSSTPDPEGGVILRDASGAATGILIDKASALVERLVPQPDATGRRFALEAALAAITSVGLTGVHDMGTDPTTWALLNTLASEGAMPVRITSYIAGAGQAFDELSTDGPRHDLYDGLLHLPGVKLYGDGALGSRGAALVEPYSDDPSNRGLLFQTADAATDLFDRVSGAGFQIAYHAIGDQANKVALDAFARLKAAHGDDGLRHRIEHAQVVAPSDIPRFAQLGIIPSMQPTHATSDMNMAEARVGIQRIRGAYAWRTFMAQGSRIAAGSDFPVEAVNPFFGLYSAVTRMDHKGRPPGGWYPEHRMERAEALRAFTLDAAWAGHDEENVGTLEPGKRADFIVIDRDYFQIPESEIWQIRVLETWIGGLNVFKAP